MLYKTQKGAANLLSYFLYIFVSIIVLSTVVYMVQETIQSNEEKYNFDEMIKNISIISNTFENVTQSRFSSREITVFNPDVLEIDCNQNQIRGEIVYNLNFRTDIPVIIEDIEISKISNRLYFIKEIYDVNQGINIDCNLTNLNKGKTNYIFRYQDYNVEENKIIVSIELLDFNKSEE